MQGGDCWSWMDVPKTPSTTFPPAMMDRQMVVVADMQAQWNGLG